MFNIFVFNILINIVDDAQQIVKSHIHKHYIVGCEEHALYIERLHVYGKYNLRISQFIINVSI